jgi:electron transport complex protein RnfE
VFGRAEAFAYKNGVGKSALDGLGAGIGVLFALSLMGLIREVLATGKLVLIGKVLPLVSKPIEIPLWGVIKGSGISIFGTSVGAFIVLGFLIAIFKKEDK